MTGVGEAELMQAQTVAAVTQVERAGEPEQLSGWVLPWTAEMEAQRKGRVAMAVVGEENSPQGRTDMTR